MATQLLYLSSNKNGHKSDSKTHDEFPVFPDNQSKPAFQLASVMAADRAGRMKGKLPLTVDAKSSLIFPGISL